MELGGLRPHSQGLSNYSYPEPNKLNSSYWHVLIGKATIKRWEDSIRTDLKEIGVITS